MVGDTRTSVIPSPSMPSAPGDAVVAFGSSSRSAPCNDYPHQLYGSYVAIVEIGPGDRFDDRHLHTVRPFPTVCFVWLQLPWDDRQ